MVPDYHIHSPLCKHAEGMLADFQAAARQRGLPEICLTDHAPSPDGYDAAHRMTLAEFPVYRKIWTDRAPAAQPRVLWGIEADFYEGCLQFLKPWLSQQPFDLVIGSVHYIRDWGFDNPDSRSVWDSVDVTKTWQLYFELVGRLTDSRLYNVVGHLDLPKKFGHRPPDRAVREMARPVLDRLAAAGMAIEINTGGLRKPVQEMYPSPLLLTLARERNIPICFGSDAHQPAEVGDHFEDAVRLARDAGYTQAVRFERRHSDPYPLP